MKNETMWAAVLHGDGDIRYERVPAPVPGPGEVKVRVRAAGICGSDVPRVFQSGAFYYPIILGHEFAGEVVETCGDVGGLKAGDSVVGAPLVPCMACEDCQRGNYASCRNYSFIGSRQQGAFCEFVVMSAIHAVPFDGTRISFRQAAMFEPATVGLHGLFCGDYQGGGSVAILGGGTIGLFTMQWARIFGAKQVTVFDIDHQRLEFLRGYGADYTVNTREEGFLEKAMSVTGNRGFDYVFETAGQSATMNIAFQIAATKANLCFIGNPHKDVVFPPDTWELLNRRELRLTASWMSYSPPYPGREWSLTAHFLREGVLKITDKLIYKTYPMSRAGEAFENFRTGAAPGKVLLVNED